MKNEEKFKVKIAEIAARIAEGAHEKEEEPKEKEEEMEEAAEESDGEKVASILADISRLDTPMKLIDQASEFSDLLKGLLGMMPRLTPQKAISGMNFLKNELSGPLAANSTPAADRNAPGVMSDKMKVPKGVRKAAKAGSDELPALQEAFNRINRK